MPKAIKHGPRKLSKTDKAKLLEVLEDMQISHPHYVVFGDGSGSQWSGGCGWGAVAIDFFRGEFEILWGSMNLGTNNVAEAMAHLHATEWVAQRIAKLRKHDKSASARIDYITDSQYCQGTGSKSGTGKTNVGIWAAFKAFRSVGVLGTWHWVGRNTDPFHRFCDTLSKLARKQIETTDLASVASKSEKRK